MGDGLLVVLNIDEERKNNLRNLRMRRRRLRDTCDPFSLNENQFRELHIQVKQVLESDV